MKTHTHPHAGMEALAARLHIRHRQLRQEIIEALNESRREDYAELAGRVHDRQDEAVADLLTDVRLADMARDVGELRDVEAALARMHAGSYGICTDCGEKVDKARLEAFPTAKRCFTCQRTYEQRTAGFRAVSL